MKKVPRQKENNYTYFEDGDNLYPVFENKEEQKELEKQLEDIEKMKENYKGKQLFSMNPILKESLRKSLKKRKNG